MFFQEFPSQKYIKQLIVIDKIKTIYCYIPKTGCTTTKFVLYNLQHNANESDVDHELGWIHKQDFRLLKHYSKKEADMRLATYNKLIVVRDPLERLASAWLDKFVHNPHRFSYIRRLQRKTLKKNWTKTTTKRSGSWNRRGSEGITSVVQSPVPFRDFIRSVIDNIYPNAHWEPFFSLCAPCQVKYDFIAHTDTLAADFRLFFHKIGAVVKDSILPRQYPTRGKAGLGNIFREVPTEDIRRIGEIYKPDFDMFGYSFDADHALIEHGRMKALNVSVQQSGDIQV
ncbi:CHST11 [Branchiostoma lanceolatum]|uniref:Carbohydrate sulfotransferase n=1 Tax=Branchiostoma lanceolatum TaxID=7740 RepID=A0A8J9Z652_BRALA|nr:CHST11 [Branchiostoma lanceolatum]